MTALHDRPSAFIADAATDRSRIPASEQPMPLAVAAALSMLAFAVGIIVAYLVFPEPTMWRVAVNAGVIVLAVVPIRALFRRLTCSPQGGLLVDPELER